MEKTLRGVYLNLEDSTFIATDGKIHLFFSSSAKMGKFLMGYVANRNKAEKKVSAIIGESDFHYEYLSDVSFYEHCENKGFLVLLDGVKISKDQLFEYVNNQIGNKKQLEYSPILDEAEIEKVRSFL